ncbi:hypothetical protein FRC17_000178, partial [Serendipita sp. 399]
MATGGRISAVSRIPTEIWWEIIEEAVCSNFVFATTYNGAHWARAVESISAGWAEYLASERQRDILSRVCTSWKRFCDSIKNRFIHVAHIAGYDLEEQDVITKAWRVSLMDDTNHILSRLTGKPVQWRVLDIHQRMAKHMRNIPHPHLRRLQLTYNCESVTLFESDNLVQVLKGFTNITWFRYRAITPQLDDCLSDDHGESIVLQHLQVLQYDGSGAFHFPYYRLILPSLRHLAIRAWIRIESFPLDKLAEAYGRSLQSLCLMSISADPIRPSPERPYFPVWAEFPHLCELSISAPILLNFHPLPLTHPLRVFAAQIWMIHDLLLSWFDSDNLRVVRILHALRKSDGGLAPPYIISWPASTQVPGIDGEQMGQLHAKAVSKGIVLQ